MKIAKELEQLKCELGVLQEVDCTEEENEEYRKLLQENRPVPDGVRRRNPESSMEYACFYTIKETALSKDEISEYLQYKQFKAIDTIKKCVVFFTVLAVIAFVGSLLLVL